MNCAALFSPRSQRRLPAQPPGSCTVLLVAVPSGRHPGQDPIEGRNPEALVGEVLLIKDPGHFAIGSGLFYVVAAAVVGDLEDFVGEVFRLTLARENIQVAKFLIVVFRSHQRIPKSA